MKRLLPLIVLGAIALLIVVLYARNEKNFEKIRKRNAEIKAVEDSRRDPRHPAVTISINGHIEGLGNDTILIWCRLNDSMRSVSFEQKPFVLSKTVTNTVYANEYDYFQRDALFRVIAENDRFQCDLTVGEGSEILLYPKKILTLAPKPHRSIHFPLARYLMPVSHQIRLFAGPNISQVTITGKIEQADEFYYLSYKVSPASVSSDYADERELAKRRIKHFDKINIELIHFDHNNTEDTEHTTRLRAKRDELNKLKEDYKSSYIKNNPNKDLSAYYLLENYRYFDLDSSFFEYLLLLSELVIENGFFSSQLKSAQVFAENYGPGADKRRNQKQQERFEKVQGKKMPEFILSNLNGKKTMLSSLKRGRHQYIVLNFWGSWCGPCLKGIPKMKEYYNKYWQKVEFVSIACREKDDTWRRIIEEYRLNWTQLKNIDVEKKCIANLYGVEVYPTKFILDKNLRVIGRFEGSGDDFYKKLDELLN